jgi:Tfp pilus assembly protein PilX
LIIELEKCDQGIALLAGLVIMAGISLLALVSTSSMILQGKMAANLHDRQASLLEAARATHWAKAWLYSRPNEEREAGCASDCALPPAIRAEGGIPDDAAFESESWWLGNGTAAGIHPLDGNGSASAPIGIWLIEEVHYEPLDKPEEDTTLPEGIAYYRILSRGRGVQASSVSVSESIVARPWGGDLMAAQFPPSFGVSTFCQQFLPAYDCGRLTWRQRR